MSYQIHPPHPSEAFLNARNSAGVALQEQFKRFTGKLEPQLDYRWIKSELTWPSFDHLTFAYGNQIFSVLVNLASAGRSGLSEEERSRCLEASREHSLVPCVFGVDAASGQPNADGWNLKHLESGKDVVPAELITDEKIPMSEWELRNFAIQIVQDHIQGDLDGKVLSFCDVLGIDPQIWFEDSRGSRCWVVVRHYSKIEGNEKNEWIGIESSNPQLASFDGYLGAVSAASGEPFLKDLQGNTIPLSERFSGKAPIYRGDKSHIRFEGLQRIFVSS